MRIKLSLTLSFGLMPLLAFAQPQQVNVYSYSSFADAKYGAGPVIKQAFEQKFPQCQIHYVPIAGSNAMFNRVRLEGKKTKADVVLGLNSFMMDAAQKSQLFTPPNVAQIHIPNAFQNPTFMAYGFAEYAFIYDKNKLKNPPTSLQDLVNDQTIRVIYEDPRTSAVGQGFLVWMNKVYGENVAQAWKTLAKHTVTVTKGWSDAYGAFLKGEADAVLSYDTSPLYHAYSEKKFNYAVMPFSNKTVSQVEYAGLVKGHESACANEFIGFLLTPVAQKKIAVSNVMLPVISPVGVPLYDDLKKAVLEKGVDASIVPARTMKRWVNLWQRTLSE